jgi:Predicted membrane protein (DUF2243)
MASSHVAGDGRDGTATQTRRSTWSGVQAGVGLVEFIDETVVHQLLHWHHFYDKFTMAVGLVLDGLFHVGGFIAMVRRAARGEYCCAAHSFPVAVLAAPATAVVLDLGRGLNKPAQPARPPPARRTRSAAFVLQIAGQQPEPEGETRAPLHAETTGDDDGE